MARVATKLGVGTAACAIAVAASVMSVEAAQAAPMAAPAAPVILGPADVPLDWAWWGSAGMSRFDLLGWFKPTTPTTSGWNFPSIFHFSCYHNK